MEKLFHHAKPLKMQFVKLFVFCQLNLKMASMLASIIAVLLRVFERFRCVAYFK